jgi:hypothetical protein
MAESSKSKLKTPSAVVELGLKANKVTCENEYLPQPNEFAEY